MHTYIARVHAFVHTFLCERFFIYLHMPSCARVRVLTCVSEWPGFGCVTNRFHLRDLVGRGSVEIKETTAGPLAKVIAGAKVS